MARRLLHTLPRQHLRKGHVHLLEEDHLSPAGGHIRYSQVVFMRCSALGMGHVGYHGILEDAVAYADRLDARVAPIACQ